MVGPASDCRCPTRMRKPGHRTATAVLLALKYDVTAHELYKAGGADLPKFNGTGGWILPAPAVFVVDREGIVRFVSVNGDYTHRAEPDEALAALDSLNS